MAHLTKKRTFKTILLLPMLLIILLIIGIFTIMMDASRIFQRMYAGEVSSLSRVVEYRGQQVERRLNEAALMAISMADDITRDVGPANNLDNILDTIRADGGEADRVLELCLPHIIDTLKLNQASGVFVVLDASGYEEYQPGFAGGSAAAVYIKDEDTSVVSGHNYDLMLLAGGKGIARDANMSLDRYWGDELELSHFDDLSFLQAPYGAVRENRMLAPDQAGCWSGPVELRSGDRVLFFTVPLVDDDNLPYGVAGVEYSLDLIRAQLRAEELGAAQSSLYAFVEGAGAADGIDLLLATGGGASVAMAEDVQITARTMDTYKESPLELRFDERQPTTAVLYPLSVYRADAVCGQRDWSILGGVDNTVLFSSAQNLQNFLAAALIISIAAGIVASVLAVNVVVSPLRKLSSQLLALDPEGQVRLSKTQIREIDMLISSIELLSRDLARTGERTLQAIEMTNMPIAFLEINPMRGRVFVTDLVFELFDVPKEDGNFIPVDQWNELYGRLTQGAVEGEENTYLLDFVPGVPQKWLRVNIAGGSDKTFGVIVDVTQDMLAKRRLEFERDTDPLTGLLNRQAFFHLAGELVRDRPGQLGIMLFADLDNLKSVNDSWGHDFGDRYIKAAARIFGLLSNNGAVVSRISGDEFAIFLYGYESRDAMIRIIQQNYELFGKTTLSLPDGSEIRIRGSIGFAWYPDDSRDLAQLLRYADFAMYQTKRSIKGSMTEFDIASYLKNSYLVEKNEAFNQFVEQNLVRYVFQPIVEIYSGRAAAYEALMRPEMQELSSPHQVLEIARTQGKLYQIEIMTRRNLLQWVTDHQNELGDRRIFMNSIPSEILSQRDTDELSRQYPYAYQSIVLEMTEGEKFDMEALQTKIQRTRLLGGQIAIDDYGAGYSNQQMLLGELPDYIKVDVSLVQGAHRDENKQSLIANVVTYAHQHGIKIVAEGVENYEDMVCLIRLGADYLQGYYMGAPADTLEEVAAERSQQVQEASLKYRDRRGRLRE